jgi:hypothetical protein
MLMSRVGSTAAPVVASRNWGVKSVAPVFQLASRNLMLFIPAPERNEEDDFDSDDDLEDIFLNSDIADEESDIEGFSDVESDNEDDFSDVEEYTSTKEDKDAKGKKGKKGKVTKKGKGAKDEVEEAVSEEGTPSFEEEEIEKDEKFGGQMTPEDWEVHHFANHADNMTAADPHPNVRGVSKMKIVLFATYACPPPTPELD